MTRRAVVVLTALIATGGSDALGIGQSAARAAVRPPVFLVGDDGHPRGCRRARSEGPTGDRHERCASSRCTRTARPRRSTRSRASRAAAASAWTSNGSVQGRPSPYSLPAACRPRCQVRTPPSQATTALVFDHLSEEALGLAQKATLEYVPMTGESDVRVGVFATDPGIRVMHGYTTDRSAIRRAVSQIMPAGSSAADQKAERRDEIMDAPPRASRRAAHHGCGNGHRRRPWRPTARGWGRRRQNSDCSRWNVR